MDELKVIKGAKIILEDKILSGHAIVFSDTIVKIVPEEILKDEKMKVIHFNGYIAPGFIDIHIHGSMGADVMDGTVESLETIADAIVQSGTTSFLATTMTMQQEAIEKSLEATREYMGQLHKGARLLGVHLEGPFINPAFKGAQNETFIQKPSEEWVGKYEDVVKMITLAPEMDEDFSFIKGIRNKDILLSIGHSGSDFETACKAYDEGVTHVTHCFNAMTGLHHRKPGVIGAVLAKPFSLDIITDRIHIHPEFVDPFIRIKTVEKTVLITDAIRANYLPDGHYDLGGQSVTVADGACRLDDGTIAGSIHKMDKALRNMVEDTGFELYEIIRMMSVNPAKKLKIFDRVGSIEEGKTADLVMLDEELNIVSVFIDGREVYNGGKS